MNLFSDFPIRLVDVSQFNDNAETDYKPTFEKLAAIGIRGTGIRVGYGLVEDRMFDWYWSHAKGKIDRLPYWYFDYYSHKGKISIEEWAIEQANVCYELLKADQGELPLHIDCERSNYGGDITLTNASEYARGVKAFMVEYQRLSKSKVSIYCSPGLMWVFGDWFKDSDLWLAWYNKSITWTDILKRVAGFKWRGIVRLWQYASDGDVNNDGIADGLVLGMESKFLDLNVFLGTEAEYSAWSGTAGTPTTPVVVEDQPVEASVAKKVKAVATVNIRNGVGTSAIQYFLGGSPAVMFKGDKADVFESAVDNAGNPWHRIGYKEWVCEKFGVNQLLKVIE